VQAGLGDELGLGDATTSHVVRARTATKTNELFIALF
jgi:hypothetical protein